MRQSAVNLEAFYGTRLGEAASFMARRRIMSVWPDLSGKDLLGYGFPRPYSEVFHKDVKRLVLAMPGEQGATVERLKRGIVSCLVDEDTLPFSDAQFDNVILSHALEETQSPIDLLNELWRVTRPEGRMLIIAANRAGLWARSDASPFGAGRPFTHTQLRSLLRQAKFEPTFWAGALYTPPVDFMCRKTSRNVMERFGETVWPGFSGLIMIEAVKRLYIEKGGVQTKTLKRPIMGTTPIGNSASRE